MSYPTVSGKGYYRCNITVGVGHGNTDGNCQQIDTCISDKNTRCNGLWLDD